MRDRLIVVTESDARMLRALIAARASSPLDQEYLEDLRIELERASVLQPGEASAAVVTMHARVRVLDCESGQRRDLVLVLPADADIARGRISVLAPMGTALLGYREGDEVEWATPGGVRRLRIERVFPHAESGSDTTSAIAALA